MKKPTIQPFSEKENKILDAAQQQFAKYRLLEGYDG